MDTSDPVAALLSSLALIAAGLGDKGPIDVNVSLTSSERVQELEKRVEELSGQVIALQSQLNRAEYLYSCEVVINTRLTDFCKKNGVSPPRDLYHHDL